MSATFAAETSAAVREYKRVYFRAIDPSRNHRKVEWEAVAETTEQAIDQSRRWAEASKFMCIEWYLCDTYRPLSIQNFREMVYNPNGGHNGRGGWEQVK